MWAMPKIIIIIIIIIVNEMNEMLRLSTISYKRCCAIERKTGVEKRRREERAR